MRRTVCACETLVFGHAPGEGSAQQSCSLFPRRSFTAMGRSLSRRRCRSERQARRTDGLASGTIRLQFETRGNGSRRLPVATSGTNPHGHRHYGRSKSWSSHPENASIGSMLREFKEFAVRGNVLDLAFGVVIGAAFGKIVTSFVNDIVMPP